MAADSFVVLCAKLIVDCAGVGVGRELVPKPVAIGALAAVKAFVEAQEVLPVQLAAELAVLTVPEDAAEDAVAVLVVDAAAAAAAVGSVAAATAAADAPMAWL